MKILVIGIGLIVFVGVLFFTIQIVKNPDLFALNKTPTDAESVSENVFVDIQRNVQFSYPENWKMIDPSRMPGFAPIFGIDDGYIAVAIGRLKAMKNTDEEIETYSSTVPIQNTLNGFMGGPVEIKIENTQKLTFQNNVGGFIFDYTGSIGGQVAVAGKIYFYRVGEDLAFAFSALVNTGSPSTASSSATFIMKADKVLKSASFN